MGKTFKHSDKYNNSHKKNRRVHLWEKEEEWMLIQADEREKKNKNYSPFDDAPEYHESFV